MGKAVAEFQNISPTIAVRNLEKSLSYYTDILGFKIVFQNPGTFAVLGRDKVRIGLQSDPEGLRAGKTTCYIWTHLIKDVYIEYMEKKALIIQELHYMESHKMNDFIVADPDGNTIGIGEIPAG